MQKTPEFDASYDPIVIKSKGMLKSTDFGRKLKQSIKECSHDFQIW